jgi:WD40 repeat protein
MTEPRDNASATLLSDGRVLIAGGKDSSNTVLTSAELYDPKTGTFSPTGSMTTARWRPASALLPDGRVLIAGGNHTESGMSDVRSAELYDPKTGTFSATGSMNKYHLYIKATPLPDGRVLIVGDNPELFDPKTGQFALTSADGYTVDPTSTLLADGRVLIADSSSRPSADLFDPKTGKFTGIRLDVGYFTATLLPDGRVLMASGEDTPGTSAALYDPKAGEFTPTGSMSVSRGGPMAVGLQDGRVLIMGGFGNCSNGYCYYFGSAELYDPGTGTFVGTGSLPGGLAFGHTATLLPDGRVLIIGCGDRSGTFGQAEVYQP